MDPISTAIIAAIAAGVTETGKKAVLDAYQGLKGLIQSPFLEISDTIPYSLLTLLHLKSIKKLPE